LPRVDDYIISPYTLGLWLGDGCHDRALITANARDAEELVENILKSGEHAFIRSQSDNVAYISLARSGEPGAFLEALKALNLYRNKHVPMEYLRGSIEQRLSLLRGLVDSDGFVSAR